VESLLLRFVAWTVDTILIAFLGLFIASAIGQPATFMIPTEAADGTSAFTTTVGTAGLSAYVPPAIVSAIYCVFLWRFRSGALVQRALGMRVLSASDLGRLTWRQCIFRWAALYGWALPVMAMMWTDRVAAVPLLWMLVLLGSALLDRSRRGLHDQIGGSVVVRRQYV
jgi:hypothetical protein